jgi:SpoVK/Ycf46/Vps4 family AAA+-type ATPase
LSDEALIASLTAAVESRPDDVPLRLHLARLLVDAGRGDEAIAHAATALQQRPGDPAARALMRRAIQGADGGEPADQTPAARPPERGDAEQPSQPKPGDLDWGAYEKELSGEVPPRFVHSDGPPPEVEGSHDRVFDVERPQVTLADVGGAVEVKQRLELAFLSPLRNPKLRRLYGAGLRGGLLMYGPPGCGKTFIARAVTGELGAKFILVSLVEVLDMWLGRSERNLHEVFQTARRNSPCVIFLDEVDALGLKRSKAGSAGMRTVVNQLLAELDGMEGENEGVFVLAATNAPWDLDPALRRPGRLDRMILVLPPDPPARQAILRHHLKNRPIENIDLARLAAVTEHFSGADLAHLCETAAEYAMHDSITSGEIRMIRQQDFERSLQEIRPSCGAWLETARNVATFANTSGDYDALTEYLRKRKLL